MLPLWTQSNWASFGQDQGASRFSKLTQINATNVQKLERAWTFHTGSQAQNEMTPLIVDSVMYLSAANGYYAVDAVTGTQLWKYDASGTTERGVSYWAGDAKSSARIIGSVAGNKLVALDAKTGKPVPGFGEEGFLDIGSGMQSPAAIYKEMLIVPSRDRTVKAWNIRTGAQIWSFNLVPQPGEPGHDSWKNDAWQTTRGVDVWGHITVDTTLGIAFVPTAPPSPDYVGINRPGDTLYGTSLVALDANTGKLRWYHQLVHHDLWDMDSAAAPTLFDATIKGVKVPAVAHMAKTGLMYMYDRRDGKPLFGEEERPVPQSNVPGEMSSLTPTVPGEASEPIARVSMKMSEIPKNVTPELASYCQGLVDKYKLTDAAPYNAWLLNQDVVELPGALGGGNWGGSSYNPDARPDYSRTCRMSGQWGHIQAGGGRGGPDVGLEADVGGSGGPGGGRGGFGAAGGSGGGRSGRTGRGGRARGGPRLADAGAAGPTGPGAGLLPVRQGAQGSSGPSFHGKSTRLEGQRFWQPDTRYSCAPTPWGELVWPSKRTRATSRGGRRSVSSTSLQPKASRPVRPILAAASRRQATWSSSERRSTASSVRSMHATVRNSGRSKSRRQRIRSPRLIWGKTADST